MRVLRYPSAGAVGSYLWAHRLEAGTGLSSAYDVVMDGTNNAYVAAGYAHQRMEYELKFGPSPARAKTSALRLGPLLGVWWTMTRRVRLGAPFTATPRSRGRC